MAGKGKFIVIEGGDGAGKDTQIELLKKDFPESGNFIYTRDPGGTEFGMGLRQITQYGDIAKSTELFVLLAARAQLTEEVIKPALRADKNVISNRFALSTVAYQGYGRERLNLLPLLTSMSSFASDNIEPDLTILLDVPPEVGITRTASRGVELMRFEKEKQAFHERVRQGYLESAKTYPNVHVVDASRSIEDVYQDVRRAVEEVLRA